MSQLPLVLNFFLSTRGDDESLAPGRIMSLAPGAPTQSVEPDAVKLMMGWGRNKVVLYQLYPLCHFIDTVNHKEIKFRTLLFFIIAWFLSVEILRNTRLLESISNLL